MGNYKFLRWTFETVGEAEAFIVREDLRSRYSEVQMFSKEPGEWKVHVRLDVKHGGDSARRRGGVSMEENPYTNPENCLSYIAGYTTAALDGPCHGDTHLWEHIEMLRHIIDGFLEDRDKAQVLRKTAKSD